MTATEILVYRSKTKMLLLLAGAIVFVVVSVFMAWTLYLDEGAGSFGVFIGLVGFLFFGFCAVLILFKLLDRRPALEFSAEGLLSRDISEQRIAWHDILAARLVIYQKQPIIELILSPQAEQSLPFTRTVRYTRAANRGLGFEGVCISGVGLDRPPADVIAMIGDWAERAQGAPQQPS